MSIIKIAGIDPSIKASGKTIMEIDLTDFSVKSLKLYAYHPSKNHSYLDPRLEVTWTGSKYEDKSILERQHIAYPILDKDMEDVKFVAFEGYAYSKSRGGSNSRGMMQLGEFIGTLKYRYFSQGKGILVYPSTSVKMLATGRGDADKIMMQRQFKNDFPHFYHEYIDKIMEWENPCSDISDSFWICEALRLHMKLDVLGSDAMEPSELVVLQRHTAKSEPICATPMLKLEK